MVPVRLKLLGGWYKDVICARPLKDETILVDGMECEIDRIVLSAEPADVPITAHGRLSESNSDYQLHQLGWHTEDDD